MKRLKNKKLARWFLVFLIFFAVLGLFFIGDISLAEARANFHDSLYFVKRQAFWVLLGMASWPLLWRLPKTFWQKVSLPLYLVNLFALGLVLLPGIGRTVWGAHRWLVLGPLAFQPAELMKFTFLLSLSVLLAHRQVISFKFFLLLLLPPLILIGLEPDLGTILVLVILGGTIYFVSGVNWRFFLALSFLGLVIGSVFIFSSHYRRQRLEGFFNPFSDPLNKTYHAYQLVITLHRGGVWGQGLGQSRQKYRYLPQVTTDSILAVIGEEIGFLGLAVFLLIFLAGLYLIFFLASQTSDPLAFYYGVGLGSWLAGQAFLNAGAVAILSPFTGVPFPLVSYGGSSVIAIFLAGGLFFKFLDL